MTEERSGYVEPAVRQPGQPARLAAALVAVILAGGLLAYRYESARLRAAVEEQLDAVAAFKAEQIAVWRAERLADAAVMMESRFLRVGLTAYLARPTPDLEAVLLDRFRTLTGTEQLDDALLVDDTGRIVLSAAGRSGRLNAEGLECVANVMRTRQPGLTRLHLQPDSAMPHLSAVAPVMAVDGSRAIGAVVLQSNARRFLDPLLERWPTRFRTAATLLLRQEPDAAVYLHALHHTGQTACMRRVAADSEDVLGLRAALGRTGSVVGKDYRGMRVVAVLRRVPDAPWILAAKVDAAEALTAWRTASVLIIALTLFVALLASATTALLWQRRVKRHALALYRAESERAASAEALKHERDFADSLIQTAPVAVLVLNPDGEIVRFNAYLETLTGRRLTEVRGRNWFEMFSPEKTRAMSREFFNVAIGGAQTHGNVDAVITRDGRRRLIEWYDTTLKDGSGVPTGLLMVGLDVTDRRRAEGRILHLNRVLHAVRGVAQLIARERDAVNLIQRACDALVEHRGYLGAWIFLDYDCRAGRCEGAASGFSRAAVDSLVKACETGEALPCACTLSAETDLVVQSALEAFCAACPLGRDIPDATHITAPLIHDGTRYGYLGVAVPPAYGEDEEELDLLREIAGDIAYALHGLHVAARLADSQKLESLDTLAGGVAHEINNPIMGIMNYAQLIIDRLPEGVPDIARFANEIVRETQRIADIVNNLLRFARQEKQQHSPAQIVDIVEQTLALVRAIMRRDNIVIETELPAVLPRIPCRSRQIQQVLMNLLTNARDALNTRYPQADPGKWIRVTAARCEREGRPWVRLSVADHGCGIPEADRPRIFDPFFTSKEPGHGTGLGLAISFGIVREHGGRIAVESRQGQGARFDVELPALDPDDG
jgi:PAS domain S-box-containing protein